MKRKDAFWPNQIHVAHQVIVVGMIGERKCGIDPVDRFGKLTPLGKTVMEGAKGYMANAQ